MERFFDEVEINVAAGHGGPGSVHFHSEKYKEFGGPDGGEGGKGGDILIRSNESLQTLDRYSSKRKFKAENGHQGEGRNKSGKKGEDTVLLVPVGTQVLDANTGELLFDFLEDGQEFNAAKGGIGGKGNSFFKTSTNQAPKFAQPGEDGESRELRLSLKLLADVGLVGLPNAGKSTLLSKITEAHPKIAGYAFTTLIPNLGVVIREGGISRYTVADIPGIIEGASKGVGLGLSFLRHIERVRGILYLFDASNLNLEADFQMLQRELESYNSELLEKPYLIVLNKIDVWDDPTFTEEILKEYSYLGEILAISAKEETHIDTLLRKMDEVFFSGAAHETI